MRRWLQFGLLVAVLSGCSAALAAQNTWAVDAKVGTLGIGADIHRVIFPDRLNLRLGVSFFQHSTNFSSSGIRYDGTFRAGAIPVSLDIYPFQNWFRVQAGLLVNLNRLKGTGQPINDVIKIGNHSYASDTIGELQGTVSVDRVVPFFGLGMGNPIKKNKRWGFFFDIGAMYHGNPTLQLETTKNAPPALPIDLQLQEQIFADKAHRYVFYPIVQLGVSFR